MIDGITIRHAREDDRPTLLRLAALDSQRAPEGDTLLAFEGSALRAALPLNGDPPIADPFERTAEIVDLIRLRADQMRRAGSGQSYPTRRLLRIHRAQAA